jgi:hypothetical protein
MTPQERLKILYERVRDFRINEDEVLSELRRSKTTGSACYSGLKMSEPSAPKPSCHCRLSLCH